VDSNAPLPMGRGSRGPGQRTGLLGRASECALLDTLIGDIRRGESRSLVLRGEAGIGKTALLEYLVESVPDLNVVRAVGVESEMELAYASVHQLCAPLLDRLECLPAPQQDALGIVFGLNPGPAPDRFLVGLAVLSLLSEVAEQGPLLCIVDDAQWLDQASALTLAFVARRLWAERVGLVFAAREPGEELGHVPALEVHGLLDADARALLSSAVRFMLDERVRDRIIAETRGNPLALLELPQGWTAPQLASGFGMLGTEALSGRIEESFARRLEALPQDSRLLLLVAAAEPVGDPLLLLRASERLGIAASAVEPATDELLAIGERVTFRPSAGALGGLPIRSGAGTAGGPSGAGGGNRSGRRSRPACVAPGCGRGGTGRAGCHGARALGRSGAGARWAGSGGRVPATCGCADRRLGPAGRQGPGGRRGELAGGRVRYGTWAVGHGGGRPR
jgi:AAA ATPase domain